MRPVPGAFIFACSSATCAGLICARAVPATPSATESTNVPNLPNDPVPRFMTAPRANCARHICHFCRSQFNGFFRPMRRARPAAAACYLRRMLRRLLPALALVACGCADDTVAPADDGPAAANPRLGTGGFGYAFGSAFPGALSPNGLCKVGPDTSGPQWGTTRFLHYTGYWDGDDTIQ